MGEKTGRVSPRKRKKQRERKRQIERGRGEVRKRENSDQKYRKIPQFKTYLSIIVYRCILS